MIGFFVCFFLSPPKTEKPRWNRIKFCAEELRKTVGGVVALLVSFRGDLAREETGGGTGWQSGAKWRKP
jgi:hypothetical protein